MIETLQIFCSSKVIYGSWVDTGSGSKDVELVQTRSFHEIYIDNNPIGGQVKFLC